MPADCSPQMDDGNKRMVGKREGHEKMDILSQVEGDRTWQTDMENDRCKEKGTEPN